MASQERTVRKIIIGEEEKGALVDWCFSEVQQYADTNVTPAPLPESKTKKEEPQQELLGIAPSSAEGVRRTYLAHPETQTSETQTGWSGKPEYVYTQTSIKPAVVIRVED